MHTHSALTQPAAPARPPAASCQPAVLTAAALSAEPRTAAMVAATRVRRRRVEPEPRGGPSGDGGVEGQGRRQKGGAGGGERQEEGREGGAGPRPRPVTAAARDSCLR